MCFLISLTVIYLNIEAKEPIVVLVGIVAFIVAFQMTQGTVFWIYAAEVCADSALGVCLFLLMAALILQSYVSPIILNSSFGLEGLMLSLAIF